MSRLFLGLLAALLVALVVALSAAAGSPAGSERTVAIPHRIVSLSPTATETLFAIGAGPQVVAVDDQSDYPKNAPHTTLSGFTPNVEAIAGYRPDLVVVSYDPNGLVATLRGLGIRVLVQDAAKTFADAYAEILQLGRLTGHFPAATSLVASMKVKIAGLVAKSTRRARGLTVYHELGPDLYSVTSTTFIGRVYSLFGLRNIADAADTGGTGYPQLSRRVRRLAEPRHRRPRRHHLLRPDGAECRFPARVEERLRGQDGHDRADRRFDRLALGAADRQLRTCGRRGAGAPPSGEPTRLWILAAAVFLVVSMVVGALVGPVHISLGDALESLAARIPFLHVHSPLSPTDEAILWDIRIPRVVARRAGRGDARAPPARRTRASSGTRWPTRTCSASPPAPGWERRSRSSTCAGSTSRTRSRRPRSLGGAVAVVAAYAIGRSAGVGSGGATLVLAGVTVDRVLHRGADVRAAAALGHAPGGLLLDPRPAAELGLARRRASCSRTSRSRSPGSCSTAGCSTCSASATRRRRASASTSARCGSRSCVCATVGTAAAVAVSGLIGFVGIIVPHAIRLVAGPSYRLLLPLSVLVGGGFLVLADVIARTALSPAELPIGVVTAFFGAPFFAVVLRTSRRMAS